MTIERLNPKKVYDGAAYGISQATIDTRTGYLFVSGQVGWNVDGKVSGPTYEEQTRRALENLGEVLAAAGCKVADLLSMRVYVRGELEEHLGVCIPPLASFLAGTRPTFTGVGVTSLGTRDTLVEIEAVARLPSAA